MRELDDGRLCLALVRRQTSLGSTPQRSERNTQLTSLPMRASLLLCKADGCIEDLTQVEESMIGNMTDKLR